MDRFTGNDGAEGILYRVVQKGKSHSARRQGDGPILTFEPQPLHTPVQLPRTVVKYVKTLDFMNHNVQCMNCLNLIK
jgi:hypothetical protein